MGNHHSSPPAVSLPSPSPPPSAQVSPPPSHVALLPLAAAGELPPLSRMKLYIPRLGNQYRVKAIYWYENQDSEFEFALGGLSSVEAVKLWGEKYFNKFYRTSPKYFRGQYLSMVIFSMNAVHCVAVSTTEVTLFLELVHPNGDKWCDKLILLPEKSSNGQTVFTNFLKSYGAADPFTCEYSTLAPKMYDWLADQVTALYASEMAAGMQFNTRNKKYFYRGSVPEKSVLVLEAMQEDIKCDWRRMLSLVAHRLLEREKNNLFDDVKGDFRKEFKTPETWELLEKCCNLSYTEYGEDCLYVETDNITWDDPPIWNRWSDEYRKWEHFNRDGQTDRKVIEYKPTELKYIRMRFYASLHDKWYTMESIDFSKKFALFNHVEQDKLKKTPEKVQLNPDNVLYYRRSDFGLKDHSFTIHLADMSAYFYFRCDSDAEIDFLVEQFHKWMHRNNQPVEVLNAIPGRKADFYQDLQELGRIMDEPKLAWPLYGVPVARLSNDAKLKTEAYIMDDCRDLICRKLNKFACVLLSKCVLDGAIYNSHNEDIVKWKNGWKLYWKYRDQWSHWFGSSVPFFVQDSIEHPMEQVSVDTATKDQSVKQQQSVQDQTAKHLTIPLHVLYPTLAAPDCRVKSNGLFV